MRIEEINGQRILLPETGKQFVSVESLTPNEETGEAYPNYFERAILPDCVDLIWCKLMYQEVDETDEGQATGGGGG